MEKRNPVQPGSGRGFTLVEVLVVVAILVMLVAMMVPALSKAREAAWRAKCASNLHQIHVAMVGNSFQGETLLPQYSAWISRVATRKAAKVLICPRDPDPARGGSLADGVYIAQADDGNLNSMKFSLLTKMMDFQPVQDGQMGWKYDGRSCGASSATSWLPNEPTKDALSAGMDNDSGVVFSFSDQIVAKPLLAPDLGQSEAWVCYAPGGDAAVGTNPNWRQEEVVVRLPGGEAYKTHQSWETEDWTGKVAPAAVIPSGFKTSYGMNDQVSPAVQSRTDQVLLIDYKKTVVKTASDVFDDYFGARHFGQANTLLIDGHVELNSLSNLEPTINPTRWSK